MDCCLGLKKHETWSGRCLNPGPTEYKAELQPISAGCSSVLFFCSTLHKAVFLSFSYPIPSTRRPTPRPPFPVSLSPQRHSASVDSH